MSDATRVLAGDCTVRYEGEETREERGAVIVVAKPDGTVLVHDSDGYRPVAWLTRAESVAWHDGDSRLDAVDNGRRLIITCHAEHGNGSYRTTRAGSPAGACPECDGVLVDERGAIGCVDCEVRHVVPRDASILDERCTTCDLPHMRVTRGEVFEVCVDRRCESLDERVKARFDREWACPDCGGDLRILRRGGLIAGCEHYPDCETGYSLPAGVLDDQCDCGLPRFVVRGESRCLDAACSSG